jgi:hypothetical protein
LGHRAGLAAWARLHLSREGDTVSEATVRAAIYALVNGVTNVGNVYDYERWAAFYSGEIDVAKYTLSGVEYYRFWTISCESIEQEMQQFSSDRRDGAARQYTYKIRGAWGLQDADESEKSAIAMSEDVMEAIDADTALQTTYLHVAPCQLDIFELRLVGTQFCHYTEITLVIQEEQ